MTLKQRVKFFFQGKPYLKIITIILSAAAFAFCSIGATGLTTSRVDCLTDAILNIPNYTRQATPGVTISYDHGSDNSIAEKYNLSQGILDILEKNINSSYLYGYVFTNGNIGIQLGASFGDKVVNNNIEEVTASISSDIVAGSQSAMEDWGFSLVAGNYPSEPDQVAICKEAYDIYKKFGYVCATNLYNYVQEKRHGYWSYDYEDEVEATPINDYSDIIGKTLAFLNCDAENGELGENAAGEKCELEIVGIINTDSGKGIEGSKAGELVIPAYKLYVSEAWREAYFKKDGMWNDTKCTYLYVVRPDSYSAAHEIALGCIAATEYVEKYSDDAYYLDKYITPHFLYVIYINRSLSTTFALFGAALGVVSVALEFFMSANALRGRRKQIGILQSLGAGKRKLTSIFMVEALALSCITFIIALAAAFGIFYGYIYGATYNFKYLTHSLIYGAWNVLILAGSSFVLPALSTFIIANNFLKRPPIENIRKTNKREFTRESREETKRRRHLKNCKN